MNGDGREEEELPRLEDLEGEGADALEGDGACEDLAGEAVWRVDAEDFPVEAALELERVVLPMEPPLEETPLLLALV